MNIQVISVGKPSGSTADIVETYIKKSMRLLSVRHKVLKDIRIKDAAAKKNEEGKRIIKSLSPGIVSSLDLRGKTLDTMAFSLFIKENVIISKDINFIIGGAYGLSDEVLERSDFVIKLSDLTMQHDVALIVLFEQIYRALTIIKGIPYHK